MAELTLGLYMAAKIVQLGKSVRKKFYIIWIRDEMLFDFFSHDEAENSTFGTVVGQEISNSWVELERVLCSKT